MFSDKLKKNQVETQMTEKVDTTELPPIDLELVGQELPFNWPFSRKVKSYIIALLINFVSAFNATGKFISLSRMVHAKIYPR